MANGQLQIQVFRGNNYIPQEKAKVTITGRDSTGKTQEQVAYTDSSGLTTPVELTTPPLAYSQNPTNQVPYSFVDIRVEALNFKPLFVRGCQIMPDSVAIQNCNLTQNLTRQEEVIDVKPNTLVGNYPPKIPEAPEKPLPKPPSGLVVLPQPVVPQYIVVHAGGPDEAAPNYTLRFMDYIKNVASCEIFSTWPESTIRANVLCIISFVLNRVYTEWYRGKGKNFTITNSTAFDQAFNYGRNIYKSISNVVDAIFSTYVKRPGAKQPLLTQFCDGKNVQCPGWLTQWGSKYLGDQGKRAPEILRNFYGADLQFDTAQKVAGIPESYPGYVLRVGSTGTPVRTIQTYLNRISVNYPAIPKLAVTAYYNDATKKSVTEFQKIFSMPAIGVVDYPTWYKISDVYVAVTKIGELRGEDNLEVTKNGLFVPPHLYKDGHVPVMEYPEE
ncbi:peptidoglycan-binding domain-containing protein [Clostridium hydrogenum]|uniref:peptidoglycan-binding domain-containing protein n=1 Tax=Clostridium hydrogenum TaxID=2855764 RepID=UPI001F253080|nr:peptidoglycan-binding domain-containing protein [Clostridium hydrogenum]